MNKPISPLRQRMIDDMTFRNMSPNTMKVYSYAVANFSAFHLFGPEGLAERLAQRRQDCAIGKAGIEAA